MRMTLRGWLIAFAVLAASSALLFARPHPTPGPPMRDFEAYYAAGAAWSAGHDPYSQAIWNAERALPGVDATRYEALPFVTPPAALPLFALLAKLPFGAANTVWRTSLLAALAALALLTLRYAGIAATPATLLSIAIAAVGFGPLTSALALGQLALPAFLLAAAALFFAPAGWLAWVQPNVALPMMAAAFDRRGALRFALGIAIFGGLCIAAVGIAGMEHYVQVLHRHSSSERFSAIQLTPASIAYGFGAARRTAQLAGLIVAVAAGGVWIVLMRSLQGRIARFCATCALLPLAVPFVHEHDLLVLFIPAAIAAARSDERVWPVACAGALLAATDWLGLAQRPDGTVQTLLLVGSCGASLAALRERPRAKLLLAPGAVLAAIALAALFAHAHPAPVWPDAMGALPRGVQSLEISSAWNAQQRATGLYAQVPVWAALRLLSLLGCALTAAAIAAGSRYPAGSRSPSPAPA